MNATGMNGLIDKYITKHEKCSQGTIEKNSLVFELYLMRCF